MAIYLGFGVIGILNYLIPHTHMFEEKAIIGSDILRTAYLVALDLILHDFSEDFAMAVPALATRTHGFLLRAATVSALAEPLGATIGLIAADAEPGLIPLFNDF